MYSPFHTQLQPKGIEHAFLFIQRYFGFYPSYRQHIVIRYLIRIAVSLIFRCCSGQPFARFSAHNTPFLVCILRKCLYGVTFLDLAFTIGNRGLYLHPIGMYGHSVPHVLQVGIAAVENIPRIRSAVYSPLAFAHRQCAAVGRGVHAHHITFADDTVGQ